jgi:hypothetical protein
MVELEGRKNGALMQTNQRPDFLPWLGACFGTAAAEQEP